MHKVIAHVEVADLTRQVRDLWAVRCQSGVQEETAELLTSPGLHITVTRVSPLTAESLDVSLFGASIRESEEWMHAGKQRDLTDVGEVTTMSPDEDSFDFLSSSSSLANGRTTRP